MRQAANWLKIVTAGILVTHAWVTKAAELTPPPTRTVASAVLRIPAGQSVWQQDLVPAVPIGSFVIQWEMAPTCRGFGVLMDVQDAASGLWHTARVVNNTFVAEVERVSALRYNFQQYALPVATCRIHLASVDSRQPTPPSRPTLAGVLNYEGGFVEHASLQLAAPLTASRIELVVPNYCRDLQVLSARFRHGDAAVDARVLGGNPLVISSPAPLTIESIDLTLIGPKEQNCELPIYVYAQNRQLSDAEALIEAPLNGLMPVEAELVSEDRP